VEVELWTDGSSTGAVGDGGWAYVLRCGEKVKEGSGYVADTTNNRMEMTGLLMGLRALTRDGVFVRGHAGTLLNERCDELAKLAKTTRLPATEIELPGAASLELEFAS
jgi:ribonuclease HI